MWSLMNRTGRLGFFGYSLMAGLLMGGARLAVTVTHMHGHPSLAIRALVIVVSLAGGWVAMANMVRRLHDIGRSGWWVALVPIPVVGWVLTFLLSSLPGQRTANRFGPSHWKSRAVGEAEPLPVSADIGLPGQRFPVAWDS
jgi:uncharacterized membrane protein YhaH (DUF805 family)